MVFVDTNVLVYATVVAMPDHATAVAALKDLSDQGEELFISRQVIREMLAVLTRQGGRSLNLPRATALASTEAWAQRLSMLDEDDQVTQKLFSLLRQAPSHGSQVHDANLVATMLASGVTRLLTANPGDFQPFEPTIQVLPLTNWAATGGTP